MCFLCFSLLVLGDVPINVFESSLNPPCMSNIVSLITSICTPNVDNESMTFLICLDFCPNCPKGNQMPGESCFICWGDLGLGDLCLEDLVLDDLGRGSW